MKVRVAFLYEDSDAFCVLLDEGQDFHALYEQFNEQDYPNVQECLGFTDFMESKGVTVIPFEEDPIYNPELCKETE